MTWWQIVDTFTLQKQNKTKQKTKICIQNEFIYMNMDFYLFACITSDPGSLSVYSEMTLRPFLFVFSVETRPLGSVGAEMTPIGILNARLSLYAAALLPPENIICRASKGVCLSFRCDDNPLMCFSAFLFSLISRMDTSVAQWTPCAFSRGRPEGTCTVFSM